MTKNHAHNPYSGLFKGIYDEIHDRLDDRIFEEASRRRIDPETEGFDAWYDDQSLLAMTELFDELGFNAEFEVGTGWKLTFQTEPGTLTVPRGGDI